MSDLISLEIYLNKKMSKTNVKEKTLVLLKPDAIQRGLIGEVTSRFEKKGLKLIGMKMMTLDKTTLKIPQTQISFYLLSPLLQLNSVQFVLSFHFHTPNNLISVKNTII